MEAKTEGPQNGAAAPDVVEVVASEMETVVAAAAAVDVAADAVAVVVKIIHLKKNARSNYVHSDEFAAHLPQLLF